MLKRNYKNWITFKLIKMKYLRLVFSVLIVFMLVAFHHAQAQGKRKELNSKFNTNDSDTEQIKKKDTREIEIEKANTLKNSKKHLEDEHKDKANKGNAYGKNKGDLSGRDFGKLRSEEAKNKLKEMESNITASETVVIKGRDKIKKAEADLEEAKKNKTIDAEEAEKKAEIIKKAHEKLNELDEKIKEEKEKVKKEKEALEKIFFPEQE